MSASFGYVAGCQEMTKKCNAGSRECKQLISHVSWMLAMSEFIWQICFYQTYSALTLICNFFGQVFRSHYHLQSKMMGFILRLNDDGVYFKLKKMMGFILCLKDDWVYFKFKKYSFSTVLSYVFWKSCCDLHLRLWSDYVRRTLCKIHGFVS